MNTKNYTLFHLHDRSSLLDGFGTCEDNVARAKELGMTSLGVSNHGNCFSHFQHWNACKKNKIKPILGNELYICHKSAKFREPANRANSHMVVWAKNHQGWLDLLELTSQTNTIEYYYYKPRISLFNFVEDGKTYYGLEHYLRGNIMGFSGHQGSHLSDNLFCDILSDDVKKIEKLRKAYGQYKNNNSEFYKQFLKPNWLESTCELALQLEQNFGKGNFFVELQNELNPQDKIPLWIHPIIVDCLREVSKQTGISAIASSDPHYPRKQDAEDQRLVVMVKMKETEESVQQKLDSNDEMDLMVFFGSDNFYIHSYEEMSKNFTKEELSLTNTIADLVEEYNISHGPYMPEFELPKFDTGLSYLNKAPSQYDKYLMFLCVEGLKANKPWTNKLWDNKPKRCTREDYWHRLLHEFEIIFNVGLSPYFLVVWDYCMAADYRPADHSFDWKANLEKGGQIDPIPRAQGRGSAAGCLISYSIGITGKLADPLLYDLLFGRFFNAGRCTKDHIELPDIDIDFAVEDREWIIKYIEHKYGQENVYQIITFQRMQGKAALKDVFRVKGIPGGFELSNEICKFIPSEAEIADELQEMRESGQHKYGILNWAVDNSDSVNKFYDDPELKKIFDQAMRCEGIRRGSGKHPSGVVVLPQNQAKNFPLVLDPKGKIPILGVDMNDIAKMGGVKMDILGTCILDKLKMTEDLVNGKTPRRNRVEFTEEE